jgi:hypothetical protein
MNELVVTLFEQIRPDIKIQIYAKINEKQELVIDGIDCGELVEKLKGDWDYEYFLTVKKTDKKLLINKLRDKNIKITNDEELLNWIKLNYSGNSAFSSFQTYLESENIKFETYFWR